MYRIGELSAHTRVSRDALRFYERQGLLQPAQRTQGGYRLYTEAAVERVRFIKQAQALGITLEEIRRILEAQAGGRPPCRHVRRLLQEKVAAVARRIAELEALRRALEARLRWAEAHPDPACDGEGRCVYLTPPGENISPG
ncbi:heavy metal-responsive transcriptional regulator [Marinithermus hydrothermalis]|uniref:Transcriptional regulator, MerR family n=1 Tax=Marinithermus hydrothermalis (strain DSM 14884 / JCM 11576 / T1) TaxID=869210 RepID=F2NN02_MARHT|nr:heavy metal-responsive transcriptional regulator [Marinithermus hydrothermalis]AEB12741.1 transcriptional regulator, MerR family [Marinithermus hydrothermalis DSM 14884]